MHATAVVHKLFAYECISKHSFSSWLRPLPQGVDGQGYQTLDLNDCRLKADDSAADNAGEKLNTTMERFALCGEQTRRWHVGGICNFDTAKHAAVSNAAKCAGWQERRQHGGTLWNN